MATIKDVARLAGVSPTTVSATLTGSAPVSEALRERVWEAVRKANYQPDRNAQALRNGVSTTVGFIAPDIAAPWVSHLAKAVQRSLSDRGYNMLLASNDDDPAREMRDIALMATHRVAGLLIAPTSLGADYPAQLGAAVACPAVLIDRVVLPERFDAVADDNVLGGQLVTDYLVRLGHRRIAMLVGRPGISASFERFDAVCAALARHGLGFAPDHVRHGIHTVHGAVTEVQSLMSSERRPTAIMCISQAQVQGAMEGLRNMGLRVPQDVSVISFDGFNPSAGWYPVITSLIQDTDRVSRHAVERLLQRIAGAVDLPPEVMRVRPHLKIGESCGAPSE